MSWIDPDFPHRATPSDLVGRVLGLNPGMMTGPGTNTYLVGRSEPILIDTGAGVAGYMGVFAEYLAERGWQSPSRVILTHRHVDHLGGVPHLRERFPGLPVAKMIYKDEGLPEGTADLRDGQVVKGDGVTLRAVHTPGHASDHLCYFLEEERALFSGDLILNGSTSVIPDEDGDLADYMASLRRVQALGVRRIYPAHGPVVEDAPGKIQEYIDHRMERERQIVEALGNGARTIPEMVKIIYA
ncbi:MAG TPA: MBL fold metallo-hydrolase, partial [Methylomirabilota bacterium]|nr:MBL fold metallo-hydrolase [Methylomirabilota bacterium]